VSAAGRSLHGRECQGFHVTAELAAGADVGLGGQPGKRPKTERTTMRRNRIVSFLNVTIPSVVLALSIPACGKKNACQEECSSDSDCQSGLACLNTISYGKACVPDRCATCFSRGMTCHWSSAYDDSKEELVCDFTRCD